MAYQFIEEWDGIRKFACPRCDGEFFAQTENSGEIFCPRCATIERQAEVHRALKALGKARCPECHRLLDLDSFVWISPFIAGCARCVHDRLVKEGWIKLRR